MSPAKQRNLAIVIITLIFHLHIADIIHSLGVEEVEITFADEATEAIINARRASLTDFF